MPDQLDEDAVRAMTDRLYATDDAMVWAEEFCRTFAGRMIEPNMEMDSIVGEGTMVGWFANAIETAKRLERERIIGSDHLHIIELRDDGWLIQHPMTERLKGELFQCTASWEWGDAPLLGRFYLEWDDEAQNWALGERVEPGHA